MHILNWTTLLLLIVGGLNWGLVGLFNFDLVAAIFGGSQTALAKIVYVLVGLSALGQIGPLVRSSKTEETFAQRGREVLGTTSGSGAPHGHGGEG